MSVYSENLYFTLELIIILILLKNKNTLYEFILLIILFICFLLTRSNAVTCLSFIIIPIFHKIFKKTNIEKLFNNSFLHNIKSILILIKNNFLFIIKYFILIIISLITFIWMIKFRPKMLLCNYINKKINIIIKYIMIFVTI